MSLSKRSRTMRKLRTTYDAFALANGKPQWDQLSQEQRASLIYIAARTSIDRHNTRKPK